MTTGDAKRLLALVESYKDRVRMLERHVLVLGCHAAGHAVRPNALTAATEEAERLAERDA